MTFSIAVRTIPARADLFCALAVQLADMMSEPGVLGLHVSGRADLTPNENALAALRAADCDGADWVIFLEDDAGPIHDLIGSVDRWLRDHADEGIHLYPLGYQYDVSGGPVFRYPLDTYYCSAGLVLRGALVESVLDYFERKVYARQGFDLLLGQWHRTVSDCPYLLAPSPMFVEHLGDESTLIEGRSMRNVVGRFRGFPGYDHSYEGQTERKASHG